MRCRAIVSSANSGLTGLIRIPALAFLASLAVLSLPASPVWAATLPEIRALAADQHYAEALRQLDGYLAGNADDVEARLFKGVILTRQGNIDQAIQAFDDLA